MIHKLDAKDRKILSVLDMDARSPLAVIAKKVGLSREVVNYRIQQLEKNEIIQGYYAAIDISKLGMMYCRTFFKYKNISHEKEKEIVEYCKKNKYITWLIFGEGKYDISIMIVCESLEILEKTYDDILAEFGTFLQNPYLSLAFRIYHYRHNYLYDIRIDKELIMGEGSKKLQLDKIDLEVLKIISSNARMQIVEIAEKIGTSAKIVNHRIKNMISNGLILAFRAKINTRLLGYDRYKVFLTLNKFNNSVKEKVITYLRSNPNVIYVTKPMGMHHLEFEVMVRNANELHEMIRDIKTSMPDIITDHETNLYYDETLLSYFPS